MVYVGLDLHKKTIQIAAVDDSGTGLMNKKIQNTREALANARSQQWETCLQFETPSNCSKIQK